jgi:hypothetical protein
LVVPLSGVRPNLGYDRTTTARCGVTVPPADPSPHLLALFLLFPAARQPTWWWGHTAESGPPARRSPRYNSAPKPAWWWVVSDGEGRSSTSPVAVAVTPKPPVHSGQAASAVEAGIRVRHPSPRFTKSCIANCESPTIGPHSSVSGVPASCPCDGGFHRLRPRLRARFASQWSPSRPVTCPSSARSSALRPAVFS